MTGKRKTAYMGYMAGASVLALGVASPVMAQDADMDADDAPTSQVAAADVQPESEILVTGIRASLQDAMNIKRQAVGVVDAISAEDIGKFPDTNLAESLQRITGVSIDRQSGEGSTVTVRGFGPAFNLVVVNGRQMPTSFIGDGFSSRSFDFANLASEGVAGVEVYKSGRASLPTGGIGSTINIKTPRPLDRPGLQGSFGAKAVYDSSNFDGTEITPEFSGIISKTFADDRIGILLAGSYQERKASEARFFIDQWRPGYSGDENNWGSLPGTQVAPGDPPENDWRVLFVNPNLLEQLDNPPGPDDVYQVPQNAAYDFYNFKRERINGQAVVQFQPTDSLNIAVDYIFSQNTFDSTKSSAGVWFNHENTSSSWTDGPAAGANFYAEEFGGPGKDFVFSGSVAANRSVNHSLGGNIQWEGPGGLRLELDAHHSTAESKPTSPYGSSQSIGTTVWGVQSQRVDFTTELPVLSVTNFDGFDPSPATLSASGQALTTEYMKDRINELTFRGGYDFDASFIESLDFGVSYIENKVRTAFGTIQNETWGSPGSLPADQIPDDIWTPRSTSDALQGMEGADDPNIIPTYFEIDTERLIELLIAERNICPQSTIPGGCLAPYVTDRRITEETIAPYVQTFHRFSLGDSDATLRLGLRYEETKIDSGAVVPVPVGTVWAGENEISAIDSGEDILAIQGKYENWLPAIDFDFEPIQDVKVRASYSHTIARPDYASIQGGTTVNRPLRRGPGGSTAQVGNPNLLPYKSKNIDLSAEWYYGPASYLSVGFFNKNVTNFIADDTTRTSLFGLVDPSEGAAAEAARAALGDDATFAEIVSWVQTNRPNDYDPNVGTNGGVIGREGDPLIEFAFASKINSDQSARLWGWEFAVQHNFWDTGFGAILNYTIVKSDTFYDNALPWTVDQFAVTGVSDSANAVLFYDKGGLQARVAYNWRDKFLSGYDSDPYYVESYGQVDASASYEFDNGLSVFVEAINLLNEDRRGVRRNDQAVYFATPGHARYAAGVRFTF